MAKVAERCGTVVAAQADQDSPAAKRALRTIESLPGLRSDVERSLDRLGSVVEGLSRFVSLDEAKQSSVDVRESLDTALSLLKHALVPRIEVLRLY